MLWKDDRKEARVVLPERQNIALFLDLRSRWWVDEAFLTPV